MHTEVETQTNTTVYILLFSFTGSREYAKELENISVEKTDAAKSDTTVSITELEKTALENIVKRQQG